MTQRRRAVPRVQVPDSRRRQWKAQSGLRVTMNAAALQGRGEGALSRKLLIALLRNRVLMSVSSDGAVRTAFGTSGTVNPAGLA
jgi:hypothetical protein